MGNRVIAAVTVVHRILRHSGEMLEPTDDLSCIVCV